MKNAPSFSQGQWPNFADRTWSESVYSNYGQTPYWDPQNAQAARSGSRGSTADLDVRTKWYRAPQNYNRLSDVRGSVVRNDANLEMGQLSDVSIDPATGRIVYGVVNRKGKMYAVPWDQFRVGADGRVTLNATEKNFPESAGFTQDQWPDMTDPMWSKQTFQRFDSSPYWINDAGPEQR